MIGNRLSTAGVIPTPVNAFATARIGSSTVNAQRLDSALRNLPHNQPQSIIDRSRNHSYSRGRSQVQAASRGSARVGTTRVGGTNALDAQPESADYIIAILPIFVSLIT